MVVETDLKSFHELAALCKRRGLIFQGSEIYGGIGGCWDYGPYGVELKNNLRQSWWKEMTYREDVVGIDSAILMHPKVWEASGHVEGFSDPLVDCKNCKERFRADNIDLNGPCSKCGSKNSFTEVRQFNLMFKTELGAVEETANSIYLRPETAQGIFVNFLNVQGTMRKKIPFGIAQVGKAFRNEITPGNFIFRTREFEQMEMQFFVKPGTQKEWIEEWKKLRWDWHIKNGLRENKLRWAPHGPDHLAHYADAAVDIEYHFPIGWGEMEGIHSRTDFDLTSHEKMAGKSLSYIDQSDGNKKFTPYVIETSVGLDRTFLAILSDAYRLENEGDKEKERSVLKIDSKLAPVKVAVLPLMKKPQLEEVAQKIMKELRGGYKSEYDLAGSIGKRYRRQDEIGTPFCITVDYDTLEDQTVTVRDRDSMAQIRVSLDQLNTFLKEKLG